jgi:multidrug resistance efflux pump
VPVLIVSLASVGVAAFARGLFGGKLYYYGLTEAAKKDKMRIQIVEKGELESTENNDIKVPVKTNNKNNSIKIKSVIEDGASVKGPSAAPELLGASVVGELGLSMGGPLMTAAALFPDRLDRGGDLLVSLDPTPLEDDLINQQIEVDKAYVEVVKAESDYLTVLADNEATIKKAKVDLEVAKLNFQKYDEGDFNVSVNSKQKEIMDATSDLKQWQDRAAWSQRMVYLRYLSQSQAISDEAKRKSSEIQLSNLRNELKVIRSITDQKIRIELKGAIEKAKLDLDKAIAQARPKEAQAQAQRRAMKSIYKQKLGQKIDVENQIAECNLYAPRDGMVVYFISQQTRFGLGSNQTLIAQGEPVVYDQKLMQIPDLTRMQVKARIHEAMVKYLHSDEGVESMGGRPAQKALIRVEAYPERVFQGHVRTVAAVASKQDWMSSDVRVYETVIVMDDKLEGKEIKPGMSAEVTVLAYESPEPVLTIPLQAVVGSITMGKERKCFVIHENGYAEERNIKIGLSNERVVEVLSGIEEGERVALDPSALLPPDGSLKAAKPGGRQMQVGGEGEGGKKKGGWPGGGKFKPGNGVVPGSGLPGGPPNGKGPAAGTPPGTGPQASVPQGTPGVEANRNPAQDRRKTKTPGGVAD